MFKKLTLKEWQQFSSIDIDFHNRLTILTGANGAGKTTILKILAMRCGWDKLNFISQYSNENDEKEFRYSSGINDKYLKYPYYIRYPYHINSNWFGNWNQRSNISDILRPRETIFNHQQKSQQLWNFSSNQINKYYNWFSQINNNHKKSFKTKFLVGKITSDTITSDLQVDNIIENPVYKIEFRESFKEKGLYAQSHRPLFSYKRITERPTNIMSREEIYTKYFSYHQSLLCDEARDHEKLAPSFLIKEALINLAYSVHGEAQNENSKQLLEKYASILGQVLPKKLGFKRIKIMFPEVIFVTETGSFSIDAVSGGIASIIDMTWQLYMFADSSEKFVALIDEPENHLHPELQKELLSNLLKAFPNVQFIVSTHNPLIITSVKESSVYVLRYNEDNKVFSEELDCVNKAANANAILSNVLGIDSTIPTWAEQILERIVTKYSQKEFTAENLNSLKEELEIIDLGNHVPQAILELAEKQDD